MSDKPSATYDYSVGGDVEAKARAWDEVCEALTKKYGSRAWLGRGECGVEAAKLAIAELQLVRSEKESPGNGNTPTTLRAETSGKPGTEARQSLPSAARRTTPFELPLHWLFYEKDGEHRPVNEWAIHDHAGRDICVCYSREDAEAIIASFAPSSARFVSVPREAVERIVAKLRGQPLEPIEPARVLELVRELDAALKGKTFQEAARCRRERAARSTDIQSER